MNHEQNPASLVEQEIQAKIAAELAAELASGKKVSDISRGDLDAIAARIQDTFSADAKRRVMREGVLSSVRCVLGSKIAEELWASGKGWGSLPEILAVSRRLKFEPVSEGPVCLKAFREALGDFTRDDVEGFPILHCFMPLFVGQPVGARLGEIAVRKAARGDALAQSFLCWRE